MQAAGANGFVKGVGSKLLDPLLFPREAGDTCG
jgi:hypothetical protein